MIVEPYIWGFWGPNCYRISHKDLLSMVECWLRENYVDYWLVSSGSNGYVIQLRSDTTLFCMRWL